MSIEPRDHESLRVGLAARWRELTRGHDDVGADLLARYADASRHYHGLEHLGEVLDHIDQLDDEADDPALVRLAAWFHDAAYDVRASDNEERSALLAESVLPAIGLDPADAAEVARLVRLTSTHAADPGDRNGVVLCDADLAILASPDERYQRYADDVRREFAHVPDREFRLGRGAILRQLLDLPHLFGTQYASTHWESRARSNLRRELAELEPGPAI